MAWANRGKIAKGRERVNNKPKQTSQKKCRCEGFRLIHQWAKTIASDASFLATPVFHCRRGSPWLPCTGPRDTPARAPLTQPPTTPPQQHTETRSNPQQPRPYLPACLPGSPDASLHVFCHRTTLSVHFPNQPGHRIHRLFQKRQPTQTPANNNPIDTVHNNAWYKSVTLFIPYWKYLNIKQRKHRSGYR